jgi:hypothetical protein
MQGLFYMPESQEHTQGEDVDFIKIGNTVYEVTSFYSGELSFMDIIKNALKRDAQDVLRQLDKK